MNQLNIKDIAIMLENAMITLHVCVCNRESKLKIVYLTLGISPCMF